MNDYEKQAEKFLFETVSKIEFKPANYQKKPIWATGKNENFGICYDVKLSNPKGEFLFNYWGSIADKERNEKPTAYDILACLQGYEPESDYYDFCSNYGYEPSKMAEKTYKAVCNEWEELSKLYTPKELEKLAEIN